jgi:hypothetical protein
MRPMPRRFAHLLLRALWGPAPKQGLHVCVRCDRDRCCPVDWEAADETHWRIALRCGECGHEREAVVTNAEAAAYDIVLDRHEAAMLAAAERISRQRLELEVETFATALADDLIAADDFASG